MKVKFINKVTGSTMYVDEARIEEYKAAGHTAAASKKVEPEQPAEEKPKTKGRKTKE